MKIDMVDGWTLLDVGEVPQGVTGLYCFCQDDEVMYLGKAVDIKNRMSGHSMYDPEFDVYILDVDYRNLATEEMKKIVKYQPPGNTQGIDRAVDPLQVKGVGLATSEWQKINILAAKSGVKVHKFVVRIIRNYLNELSNK